jgi:glycosyltransferase involved in cell wall biosynthesis
MRKRPSRRRSAPGVAEVCVIDDASADGTAEVARASGGSKVKVISQQTNAGASRRAQRCDQRYDRALDRDLRHRRLLLPRRMWAVADPNPQAFFRRQTADAIIAASRSAHERPPDLLKIAWQASMPAVLGMLYPKRYMRFQALCRLQ